MDPSELDVGYLALFSGYAFADEVQRALRRRHPKVKFSWGFVFQHLVAAKGTAGLTIGELAKRMEVTQQGASKALGEIVRAGYVAMHSDPADRRVRRVRLTQKGWDAVESARRERRDLERRLARKVGARQLEVTRLRLVALLRALGGVDAVRRRRVVAPR